MSNSATPEPGAERTLRSTTRNPRRRPRESNAESQRSAPRRKRSKINENTFVPPRHDEEPEEEINGTIEVAAMNGHVETPSPKRGRGRPRKASKESAAMPPPPPTLDIEMPMRAKKTSVKRPTKGDGATILAQNARYSVKKLPSTPKDLKRGAVEFRGSLGAGNHALAVTREKAYVWDYTSHTPVNNPKVFDVPVVAKPTEPLPLGALVTTGASTDVGLVLLSATTGKVHYFESIERAASLGLFQERNSGIDGSLGNLFSGETITDIISAQHAGFVITFSSGRLAQLTLRDQQGKARIFAQFLRTTEPSSGGLFGSIKGLLTPGAWKRDLAAVHTRQLGARGQMQVISLTERAELQIWDLDWSGQYRFKSTIDFGEPLRRELRKAAHPELQGHEENVAALDFTILEPVTESTAVATVGSELPLEMLVLVRVGPRDHRGYALATISIEGQTVEIPQVLSLKADPTRSHLESQDRPRLLLPKPRHTALVAFKHAILLKQLEDSDANSPEAQLHASYIPPDTFEDSVYLKEEQGVSILGAGEEHVKGAPESAIVFVNGAGLVRISVVDPKEVDHEEQISIKNKIEQAVFHGILQQDNIIDFALLGDTSYSPEEVEAAVLSISDEILRSTSPFISTSPTSIDAHFAFRAQALRALVTYARQNFPTLSQAAMWQILWDAERVAAGLQLSKVFEEHVESSWQTKRKGTVLDTVCQTLQDSARNASYTVSDNPVRNFWISGLNRLGDLLLAVHDMIRNLQSEDGHSAHTKVRLLKEANDVYHAALETVFAFRTENAAAYGILPEFLEHGVLNDPVEYAELPEFWTSTNLMSKGIDKFAHVSGDIAQSEFEKIADGADEQAMISRATVAEISENSPRNIELMCNIFQERINWLASRPSERDRESAEELEVTYHEKRHDHIRALANVGQSEAGMKLAEQYKDMKTLTEMVVADTQWCEDAMKEVGPHEKEEIERINDYAEKMRLRVERYFEEFGDDWANAYFGEGFDGAYPGSMLKMAQDNWPAALTKYLHADPSRAKLSWINDINMDRDFSHASESLMFTAIDQAEQLWAKKVELSLGKLSLLAAQEDIRAKGHDASVHKFSTSIPEQELDLVAVQEKLYWHLVPEITHCIDHQAEVEVVMQKFANKVHDLPTLRQLLESNLDRALNQHVLTADELIDTLTLLDNLVKENVDERNLDGTEFFLALKVLNAIALVVPQDRFDTLLQLIWKRCYIYDNWVEINNRQKQSDDEVREKVRQTAPWRTLMHAAENGFFDSPSCHVRHLLPSECLGASCKPEDLQYRFPHEDMVDRILHDNRIQDEQLASYVTDRNLDSWIEGCVEDVKSVQEQNAEQKAQMLEKEREFEASVQQAKTNGSQNGHVPNGLLKVGGADHDVHGSDAGMDVEMG